VYGHIELVAVGILEMQELSPGAAGLQRDQAQIAADTVFFVDHRGALVEVVELPDDGLGIPLGAPASIALAQFFAE
jgi:hypothetical protein